MKGDLIFNCEENYHSLLRNVQYKINLLNENVRKHVCQQTDKPKGRELYSIISNPFPYWYIFLLGFQFTYLKPCPITRRWHGVLKLFRSLRSCENSMALSQRSHSNHVVATELPLHSVAILRGVLVGVIARNLTAFIAIPW